MSTIRPQDGPITEVWYPVDKASGQGLVSEVFDHLSVWPLDVRQQIPPELFPTLDTGAYRDALPSSEGPFPLVIYSHGFGGYRQMSSFYTTHLASWGFVVAAPDHEGRGFLSAVEGRARRSSDLDVGDIQSVLAAITNEAVAGQLAPVVDAERLALTGYSAGASSVIAAADLEQADTFIALSGHGGLTNASRNKPALIFAEEDDRVVPAFVSRLLFERMTDQALLVVIQGGGHSALVDLCPTWSRTSGLMGRLQPWLGSVTALSNGCSPQYPQAEDVWKVLNHLTIAHLYDVFEVRNVDSALTQRAAEAVSRVRMAEFEMRYRSSI